MKLKSLGRISFHLSKGFCLFKVGLPHLWTSYTKVAPLFSSDNSSAASRMKKFRQEDFQDDDDEERKNTYNGNSTQQQ